MDTLHVRFVDAFGEHLALSIEAAIEHHVPALKVPLERGSDRFRFALVWAIGLECLSNPAFRAEHGIVVPWASLRAWLHDADLLAGYDGTFDFSSLAVGRYEGILDLPTEADIEKGTAATHQWLLATAVLTEV
jgi:hypothetical protein